MSALDEFQRAFDPAAGLQFQPDRAYWLGKCAELVYPSTEAEVQADREARQACAVERALSPPWWRPWLKSADPADVERARVRALAAAKRVVNTEALRIEGQARAWGFDRFQFISGHSTQCFVAASDRLIVVCFRGTEPNRIWDVYADLMAIPMRSDVVPGDLHLGFWTALGQVWGDAGTPLVWPTDQNGGRCGGLPECLRTFTRTQNPQAVWITGHSLGGAMATMAAARLVGEGVLPPEQIGGVYTFGQPRVGDKLFATAYQDAYELGARHFRVVHDNDVVTRVPPESLRHAQAAVGLFVDGYATRWSRFQYQHVGHVAFLSGATVTEPDIPELKLLQLRMTARLKALLKEGPLRERMLPGLSDHSISNYNKVLAGSRIPDTESSSTVGSPATPPGLKPFRPVVTDQRRTNVLALCGGSALGLLAGLLMGLSDSLPVNLVNGGLAAWLGLTLGLDDRHITQARAMALAAIGFAWVASVLLGIYIRIA